MNDATLERVMQVPPSAPRGRRAQIKAANRQAILDAAREVFSELGYGATSVRDIIRGTNLASGTFYNYFKSKEEVFQALMDENALHVRPLLREARARAETFEEFIRETFRVFFEFCATDRASFAMMRRNAGQLRVRMDTAEVIAGFEELHDDIAAAMDKGLLPKMDVGFLTSAAVGIAFEVADEMMKREPMDPEAATEFATALMMGGIGAVARTEG